MASVSMAQRTDQRKDPSSSSTTKREKEIIHSGHFMMSNVPQDEEEEEDDVDSDYVDETEPISPDDIKNKPGISTNTNIVSSIPVRPALQGTPLHSTAAVGRGGVSGRHLHKTGSRPQPNRTAGPSVALGDSSQGGSSSRGRSNSMSEDAFGVRSRMNITQQRGKVIDSSLSKLFECMTLAYRAKLTSPKWNNFKGLKLRWTIKIRLNNVIWRAWHMQFVKQVRPLIAPFAIEVDTSPHNKAEAVILEGKYWKRRMSMVSSEYRRWRVWYKDKAIGFPLKPPPMAGANYDLAYMEANNDMMGSWSQQAEQEPMLTDDFSFLPDFTDALLARLTNQPFAFPDPREIAQAGINADFIQPGLLQLQPTLDDLMDTLEPLSEYFAMQAQGGSGYNNQGYGGYPMGSGTDISLQADPYASSNYWRTPVPEVTVTNQQHQQAQLGPHMPSSSDTTPLRNIPSQQQHHQQQRSTNYTLNTVPQPAPVPVYQNYSPQTSVNMLSSQQQIVSPPPAYNTPYGGSTNNNNSGSNLTAMLTTPSNEAFRTQHSISPEMQSQQQPTLSDLELRKQEMRQRSMSGPTLSGQPLIDPSVFAALRDYNRSVSASSGNVSQPPFPPDSGSGGANTPVRQNSLGGGGNNETFAVPQPSTRGRRGKGARGSNNVRFSVDQPLVTHPLATVPQSPAETSTLAQLLTAGIPSFPNISSAPPAKKIAPKTTSASTLVIKDRAGSVSTFSGIVSATNMSLPPSSSTFGDTGESSVISRLKPVVPKLEYGVIAETSQFRVKMEDGEKPRSTESRRINHITAEQKRRGHIKSGFEILHGLVPSLAQNPSVKVSKAVVLHKGAEYIHQLKDERRVMQTEAEALKQQIETINQAVNVCQQQLPATGVPVNNRARNDRMNEMLDEYIRARTVQNWKFWLFSLIMRPLFENYTTNVSSRSVEELCQSALSWVDQQCTLIQLRPLVKESMRKVSISTRVLSDPTRLPEEALQAVQVSSSSSQQQQQQKSYLSPSSSSSNTSSYS